MTGLDPPDDATEYHHREAAALGSRDPDPDRPRYRALARRRYDHEPGECTPEDPDHRGHLSFCHAGWELTVYRVDAYWLAVGGERAHAPLGVVRLGDADDRRVDPRRDPWYARDTVIAWLRLRAAPRPTRAESDDVELYTELP